MVTLSRATTISWTGPATVSGILSPFVRRIATIAGLLGGGLVFLAGLSGSGSDSSPGTNHATLSAPFERKVLTPPGEAPFDLRFFSTAVKTDSQGRIITGQISDPV